MSARLTATPFSRTLAQQLEASPLEGMRLYWLGQAGFVIEADRWRLAIDPYLSDTLATKYANTPYPHRRLMAAPIAADDLGAVDLVLCTHAHTDHMDPGTLIPLAARCPSLRVIAPAACETLALTRTGAGADRLLLVDAGQSIEPLPGLRIRAVRAAHETLDRDEAGRHRFLGYAIAFEGVTIFHSGDCVPFAGQRDELSQIAPDLALLPVNGRSAALSKAGFAGNFTIDEAVSLCASVGIRSMIAHHYGMFAFNTCERGAIDAAFADAPIAGRRAQTDVAYTLRRE